MLKNKKFLKHYFLIITALFIVLFLNQDSTALEKSDLTKSKEQKIELSELPIDVLAFIKESWNFISDDKVLEIEKVLENDKIYYELEFQGPKEDERISVKTSEGGVPLEMERNIALARIPADILKSLKTSYPTFNIMEAEIEYSLVFEVTGIIENQECEIKFMGSGKILEKECE